MQIGAIRRLCERHGGFATVLSKGDATAGDILLIMRQRHGSISLACRAMRWDGPPSWANVERQVIENERELELVLAKRRAVDIDLWLMELDVPDTDQFVAFMGAFG